MYIPVATVHYNSSKKVWVRHYFKRRARAIAIIHVFLVASCKRGSPAELELKAEVIISILWPVATIHYNSSKSVGQINVRHLREE